MPRIDTTTDYVKKIFMYLSQGNQSVDYLAGKLGLSNTRTREIIRLIMLAQGLPKLREHRYNDGEYSYRTRYSIEEDPTADETVYHMRESDKKFTTLIPSNIKSVEFAFEL